MKRPSNWAQMSRAERSHWYSIRRRPKPTDHPYFPSERHERNVPGSKKGTETINPSARSHEMTVSAKNAKRLSGQATAWLQANDPLLGGVTRKKPRTTSRSEAGRVARKMTAEVKAPRRGQVSVEEGLSPPPVAAPSAAVSVGRPGGGGDERPGPRAVVGPRLRRGK